jgi:hypothetical protein
MPTPEELNYQAIERLQSRLAELRADRSTAREREAMREVGYEIAIAVREVGAMLVNVAWEQAYATKRSPEGEPGPDDQAA